MAQVLLRVHTCGRGLVERIKSGELSAVHETLPKTLVHQRKKDLFPNARAVMYDCESDGLKADDRIIFSYARSTARAGQPIWHGCTVGGLLELECVVSGVYTTRGAFTRFVVHSLTLVEASEYLLPSGVHVQCGKKSSPSRLLKGFFRLPSSLPPQHHFGALYLQDVTVAAILYSLPQLALSEEKRENRIRTVNVGHHALFSIYSTLSLNENHILVSQDDSFLLCERQ